MTIEKFLSFWSQHNTAIIEGLVALVILLSLFLAYRSFFSKKSASDDAGVGHGLDASQLEKTLQKILDNQATQGGKAVRGGASEDLSMDIDIGGDLDMGSAEENAVAAVPGRVAESPAEVSQLRLTLNESHQKIETLQKQLKEALAVAEAASAGGAVAGGAGADAGVSAQEREDLSAKIRDLEARLAEYEIISEDIADLSRYREENEQLRKEIEALKAGGAKASPLAQAAAPIAEPAPISESVPAASVSSESVAEAAAAEMAPAPSVEASPADSVIDDDLMKEFAAAVEGQKNLSKVASKAGDGSEAPKADGETDKLMNEFENFVAKKS